MAKPRTRKPSGAAKRGHRSKQATPRRSRTAPPRVDIGIITIRDDEFEAVLRAFPEKDGYFKRRREYTIRWADAGGGDRYRLALLRQIEQGNGEAQDAARDLLDDLKPSLLLVVGIAGGLPSDDFTLGDVVLSTRVNDYSLEARREGAAPTYNLSGGPIAKAITSGIANLAGRTDDLGAWAQQLPPRPSVAWSKKGQVYGPTEWQADVRRTLERHFGAGASARPPRFIAGTIASSDRLIKDPAVLFPWIQTARHLLAIEMESCGVYRAARERSAMLAIRGISDIVGLKRSDEWTKYACESAAAFARAYLRTRPVPPRSPGSGAAMPVPGEPAPADSQSGGPQDVLFANLQPLREFPETIYVAPANCASYPQAWAILRDGYEGQLPRAWLLHNKNVYSFVDPSASRLAAIADAGAVEAHPSAAWANSDDALRRRLFAQLLSGALCDDLAVAGVRFYWKDDVYAFLGRPDGEPRREEYRNVHQRSTLTVVAHYQATLQDGTPLTYMRHLAFRGRFRFYDGVWYLEVTPTYRFTTDGSRKYRFHEDQLKGIKRLEKNRAVLSQILLWGAVLRSEAACSDANAVRLLGFGEPPTFKLDAGASEIEWLADADEEDEEDAAETTVAETGRVPTDLVGGEA